MQTCPRCTAATRPDAPCERCGLPQDDQCAGQELLPLAPPVTEPSAARRVRPHWRR